MRLFLIIFLLLGFLPFFISSQNIKESGFGLGEIEIIAYTTSSYQLQFINIDLNNYQKIIFDATASYATKVNASTTIPTSTTSTLNFTPIPLTVSLGSCKDNSCTIEFYYASSTTSTINLDIYIENSLEKLNVLNLKINQIIGSGGKISKIEVFPNVLWANTRSENLINPNFFNFEIDVSLSEVVGNLNLEATFLNKQTSTSLIFNNITNATKTITMSIPSSSIPTSATSTILNVSLKRDGYIFSSTSSYITFKNPPQKIYSNLEFKKISQFVQNKCLNFGSITSSTTSFGIKFKDLKEIYIFLVCKEGVSTREKFLEYVTSSCDNCKITTKTDYIIVETSSTTNFNIKFPTSSYNQLSNSQQNDLTISFYFGKSSSLENSSCNQINQPYYCAQWTINSSVFKKTSQENIQSVPEIPEINVKPLPPSTGELSDKKDIINKIIDEESEEIPLDILLNFIRRTFDKFRRIFK